MTQHIKDIAAKLAELRAIKNPTGWIHMAIGGLQTAMDNLGWHVDAQERQAEAAPTPPAAPEPAPAQAPASQNAA